VRGQTLIIDYLSIDGDDLTKVKIRIYLTWHQINMISVYQMLFWMMPILARKHNFWIIPNLSLMVWYHRFLVGF